MEEHSKEEAPRSEPKENHISGGGKKKSTIPKEKGFEEKKSTVCHGRSGEARIPIPKGKASPAKEIFGGGGEKGLRYPRSTKSIDLGRGGLISSEKERKGFF